MTIALTYDAAFPGDSAVSSMIRAGLREEGDKRWQDGQECIVEATVWDSDGTVSVRLEYTATLDVTTPGYGYRLENLAETLEKVVAHDFDRWRHTSRSKLTRLGNSVKNRPPQVTVRVPLLAADRDVVINHEAARRAVTVSVREAYKFWSDQEERLRGLEVRFDADALVITAPSIRAAVGAGTAYLSAARRRARAWASLPPTPVWAWASAAIALASFGLSWAPLTTATLATFGAVSASLAAAAVTLAPRLLARRSVTAWGMAPILTLVVFACAYGAISLLGHDAITINGTSLHHLREPFLLSLSLLSTVGVLDLHVHQWVRSLAYLEMLLIASLAGGAAVVAARRVSRRVEAIVDELRLERG